MVTGLSSLHGFTIKAFCYLVLLPSSICGLVSGMVPFLPGSTFGKGTSCIAASVLNDGALQIATELRRIHILVFQREHDIAHPRAPVECLPSVPVSSVEVVAVGVLQLQHVLQSFAELLLPQSSRRPRSSFLDDDKLSASLRHDAALRSAPGGGQIPDAGGRRREQFGCGVQPAYVAKRGPFGSLGRRAAACPCLSFMRPRATRRVQHAAARVALLCFSAVAYATTNFDYCVKNAEKGSGYQDAARDKQSSVLQLLGSTRQLLLWHWFDDSVTTWVIGLSLFYLLRQRNQQYLSVPGMILLRWLRRPTFHRRYARSVHLGVRVFDASANIPHRQICPPLRFSRCCCLFSGRRTSMY